MYVDFSLFCVCVQEDQILIHVPLAKNGDYSFPALEILTLQDFFFFFDKKDKLT